MIVAEMSGNHNGSLKKAVEIIKAAKQAGADAIKLQTYTADTLTLDCHKPDFMTNPKGPWAGRTAYSLYEEAHTPWEWHEELFRVAREEGILCFSSPFDRSAVDFLESLGNPIYKIASPEITDIPLIEYVASKGKPVVFSSGIATREDIELALSTCRAAGNDDITLLKCTTAYPTPLQECNLAMIPEFARTFGVKAGLSDHTLGSLAPIIAVSLGAVMVEKHFIIDRSEGGPDSSFSMDQEEFSRMVKDIRNVEAALGSNSFDPSASSIAGRRDARSIYIAKPMKKGDTLDEENLRVVRPGFGLHPKYYKECLGKRVNRDLEPGDPFSLDLIEP